ncbi:uncharacterized protein LOC116850465 [Odontomachus brunneus]|uniref:uncharacterized protein LOC116850465 n=1 Tax=Odontomachus brunneus TaxID=486640 RepID=UPI0013F253F0|nr:uncharacterized protein LOC116850465 [Odontomachus brunneus]
MTKVKAEIDISALGIKGLRPKYAATGALLVEVPGEGGADRADKLAALMRTCLEGTGAKVARPTKRVEMRVSGLADGTRSGEVIAALVGTGGCPEGDLRVGEIRRAPSGLGTVWCQVPLAAARRLAAASEGRKLCIGWMLVRAEVLSTRPMQCYRCLEIGHPRQRCTSAVDRSDKCYRCGECGHRAATCSASPKCPLCTDLGRPSNHRLGAPSCAPAKKGVKRGGAGGRAQGEKKGAEGKASAGTEPKSQPS